jgi:hypothetical protein
MSESEYETEYIEIESWDTQQYSKLEIEGSFIMCKGQIYDVFFCGRDGR